MNQYQQNNFEQLENEMIYKDINGGKLKKGSKQKGYLRKN